MPSRYIEFEDRDLSVEFGVEMARVQAEMRGVLVEEEQAQRMLAEAFGGIGYGISEI